MTPRTAGLGVAELDFRKLRSGGAVYESISFEWTCSGQRYSRHIRQTSERRPCLEHA